MTTFTQHYAVRPASFALVLLLGLLAGGCGYSAPKLSVSEAHATERTPDGLAMVFTIEARNDNTDALPLRNVEYSLELNGKRVFSGTRSAEATIRRLGTQSFSLPAVVNLPANPGFESLSGPAQYRLVGSVQYVTPGQLAEVLFDAGVRVPKVGFSGDGQIDFSAARTVNPTVAPANPLSIEIIKGPGPTPPTPAATPAAPTVK